MKLDRREFLKAAAMMGMFMPITEAYGSSSQRHVHRGSDDCTSDVKYLHVSLKEVLRPKNIRFSVQHQGKTVKLAAHYWSIVEATYTGEPSTTCWSTRWPARVTNFSTMTLSRRRGPPNTDPCLSAATGTLPRSPAPGCGRKKTRAVKSLFVTRPMPRALSATNSSRRNTSRAQSRASGCERGRCRAGPNEISGREKQLSCSL